MIIPPGTSQSIRVQWVGEVLPDRELAYRLITTQLPIRINQTSRNDRTADLTMKYRYEAALYIVPRGVEPRARLSSAEVIDEEGSRRLRLTLVSEGTKRAILSEPRITLAGSSGEVVLEGDRIKDLEGMNILPGMTRVVDLPAPDGLAMGEVPAEMESRYLFVR
jgi:fimbrial chaperone protein